MQDNCQICKFFGLITQFALYCVHLILRYKKERERGLRFICGCCMLRASSFLDFFVERISCFMFFCVRNLYGSKTQLCKAKRSQSCTVEESIIKTGNNLLSVRANACSLSTIFLDYHGSIFLVSWLTLRKSTFKRTLKSTALYQTKKKKALLSPRAKVVQLSLRLSAVYLLLYIYWPLLFHQMKVNRILSCWIKRKSTT